MQKISVFLCDDNPLYLASLRMLIKTQENMDIAGEALNGKEALAQIQKIKPDICLIDLAMPVMNGGALIENLHRLKVHAKLIVLSSFDSHDWLDRLIKNDIDGFVLKQDKKEDILNAIVSCFTGDKFFSQSAAKILFNRLGQTLPEKNPLTDLLSAREKEVALCTSKGLTIKEIAESLGCSENTIKTHKANLMRKIDVRNSAEITAWTLKNL